jgi:hypothetical protein
MARHPDAIELIERRTKSAKYFANPDGTRTRVYSPECVEKQSEKGRKGLQRSPTEHPRAHFFLRIYRPNPRSERCSYPFSDSFEGEFCEVRIQHPA